MDLPTFFDSRNSTNLYGLKKEFLFLSSLYLRKKLPKILMLSGSKGSGKSTLINHFLFSIFDEKNYNKENLSFNHNSALFTQLKNNIFSNIIYLAGSDLKSVSIDDIRALKSKIFQSSILQKDRFIILDDVELFNINSLNALLKIIEEPNENNYFILINNKSKPLLETIRSRSIEIKIILNDEQRLEIIDRLVSLIDQQIILDPKNSQLTPGNYIKFNYLFEKHSISLKSDFVENLSILLNLYKKNKDIVFINIAFFITDFYLKDHKDKNTLKNEKIFELKSFIIDNLNNFLLYNINHNSFINAVNSKLNYE